MVGAVQARTLSTEHAQINIHGFANMVTIMLAVIIVCSTLNIMFERCPRPSCSSLGSDNVTPNVIWLSYVWINLTLRSIMLLCLPLELTLLLTT